MRLGIISIALVVFCTLTSKAQQMDPDFASYDLSNILSEMDENGSPWLSFFDGQNLFTGIYRLKAGAEDQQQPHKTDEVYYVISGKAKFQVGDQISAVKKGQILFVKADVDHRFFEIEEELVLLVFFDK